jgi:hypothetical protein
MSEIESIRKTRKAKFKQAAIAGLDTIYTYGLDVLAKDKLAFYDDGKHLTRPLTMDFEPNPFRFQYDLEVHIFLNYNSLVHRQADFIRRLIKKEQNSEKLIQLTDKLQFVEQYGTGFDRQEHFWHACELRWPTKILSTGEEKGDFVRDPWGEDFMKAVCDYEYVFAFGGSGQGKTHRALAFMCVGWDHFIDTQRGARCRFSTVSEDKMRESPWPYLQRIYESTPKNISLYAGRGIKVGDYTITRPHDRKGGSSIKGILIPRRSDNVAVDKITGSHGHPLGIYHIDELQATPEAPIEASPNFLQNCKYGWITASGNFDLNNDSLGKNVKPVQGWDQVDETTHIYECINMLGIRSAAIHYNNDLSPAFDGEGAKRWPYLPTKKKKDRQYPNISSQRTNAYRRLWIGWREKALEGDSVLSMPNLREMGAMTKDPNWDFNYPVTHCWSMDSAPTSTDRNILTHFADGVDATTKRWKLHFYQSIAIKKIDNADEYLKMAVAEVLMWNKRWGVQSGNAILDWTNITGLIEKFKDEGFLVRPMVYNQAPPDGKKPDKRTKQILREVIVHADTQKKAHQEVTNYISMGALLAQNFLLSGQITGLHEGYIDEHNSSRSYEEEFCLRKFITVQQKDLGELLALEPKHSKNGSKGFTKVHGFSPDILDTVFQACVYAAVYRGMVPGLYKGSYKGYKRDLTEDRNKDFERELDLVENECSIKEVKSKRADDYYEMKEWEDIPINW